MHLFFEILIVIVFANISYGGRESKTLTESYHPRYSTVGNPNIPPEYDCALRAFAIEMAAYIAPAASKTNWTTLSQSAFQRNQCNDTAHTAYQPPSSDKPFKTARQMKKGVCHQTLFVYDLKGNDVFDGTFERPMKTIQAALYFTRTLRTIHGSDGILSITIRGGCDPVNMSLRYLAYKKIYIPTDAQDIFGCQINGTTVRLNQEQWQSLGLDIGTTVQTAPSVQKIIHWGREMLQHTV